MSRPEFFPLLHQPRRILVGLMSGTSVDGVDAAVVSVTGQGEAVTAELLAFFDTPFEPGLRQRIFDCFDPQRATVRALGALHMELGEVYAAAALRAVQAAGLRPGQVDAIGSHGQTVWHEPCPGTGPAFTVQLGDGNVIAQRTGIPCVSDFRTADMAAGGQGAPLVPFTEYLLYRSEAETVLLQNIGGIGNLTVLPAGCTAAQVYAFDTGPGNMVLDGVVSHLSGGARSFDEGGALAAAGAPCEEMLAGLLCHPYFAAPPPKTTGREMFGAEYTREFLRQATQRGLSPQDTAATATALTARSIAQAVGRFVLPRCRPKRLVVGGGGSYNPTMMAMLGQALQPLGVAALTQEQLGHSSDAKEAVAFALLADCALRGVPAALPAVTGAAYPAVLGKLAWPGGVKGV